ncbi:phosphoglycerate dehydrogenase [bacterium]|nr:phosphoglycerate dehydrogenase [bacterium]NCQ54858.1 phosphoglycerate dehydrogenase [Candidatus Parcubacteria bacterium]NCS66902.1 phosphoglycerate dehydrogenase [Candidatus Peregrinibacteria bacterium]NCS95848.1 phosphoglycerate dehydrogenase [bacterium]
MNQSLNKDQIKILLLEGVHQNAVDYFKNQGYSNIESLSSALPEAELIERIKDVHFLGIRSRTQLNAKVLAAAEKLVAAGCFCIGTNQVDLEAARARAIPIFNAPFANTRSVAELTMASAIHLMRGTFAKSMAAHRGEWLKSAANSYEVRGKKLGIVGYGSIGSQLSVIASALGMHVYFYDTENKLAHGNAQGVSSLDELLKISDVLTLHVPETPSTKDMINAETLAKMKPGSHLINYARGTVVDIEALAEALKSGHIGGAALDVFPVEPKGKDEAFVSPIRGIENVIITPHVGGSTQEAQANIGVEVAEKLVKYSDNGSTASAVNFPEVALPGHEQAHRIMNIHQNKPGMMSEINKIFSDGGANVMGQFLQTSGDIGYVVIDIDADHNPATFKTQLKELEGTIKTRILH